MRLIECGMHGSNDLRDMHACMHVCMHMLCEVSIHYEKGGCVRLVDVFCLLCFFLFFCLSLGLDITWL